jgi:hypothetical protein
VEDRRRTALADQLRFTALSLSAAILEVARKMPRETAVYEPAHGRRLMQGRNAGTRISAVAGALVLITSLAPICAEAGILRDAMVSLGISKRPKEPTAAEAAKGLPRHGFACCNLHYSKDWINDGNYAELAMISAGTPIEVISYGRDRAYVNIDGKAMRLGHDYGRDQESLEAWVNKIVVSVDPRPRIQAYPKAIQEAIYQGKVMPGMTREQIIASVGYPLTSENVSLDQPIWRMWRSSHGEYQLHFRSDGRLESVTGDDSVTSLMVFRPGS